eukprot:TRINITY_DN5369_c0_g1_i2.p1 TRINITY_DN5369_c0_g1~~TRINITY_DN5369_c0_g1_i2.p1  ORF type:complete len:3196 (-),score=476.27 TRINITY_DN5369_c0_g1_i2:5-8317(-)
MDDMCGDPNQYGQGVVLADGVVIAETEKVRCSDGGRDVSVVLDEAVKYLTIAMLNGDSSTTHDDQVWLDPTLTLLELCKTDDVTFSLLGTGFGSGSNQADVNVCVRDPACMAEDEQSCRYACAVWEHCQGYAVGSKTIVEPIACMLYPKPDVRECPATFTGSFALGNVNISAAVDSDSVATWKMPMKTFQKSGAASPACLSTSATCPELSTKDAAQWLLDFSTTESSIRDNLAGQTFMYSQGGGAFASVTGWSHTRDDSTGFLCDGSGGCDGSMSLTFSNLAGKQCHYAYWGFATGVWSLSVNGLEAATGSSAATSPTTTLNVGGASCSSFATQGSCPTHCKWQGTSCHQPTTSTTTYIDCSPFETASTCPTPACRWEGTSCRAFGQAPPLVTSGFEYINSAKCATGPGELTKTSSEGAWNCVGFDTRTGVLGSGSGARGISFKCPCTNNYVSVGLQQAVSSDARPSQPSTWDTSSNSDFKELYDSIVTDPSSCTGNACAGSMHLNGFDAGFSCRHGTLYAHYGNSEAQQNLGTQVGTDTLSLVVEGDVFKWYVGDNLKKTATGISGQRSGSSIRGPLWVVAVIYGGSSCNDGSSSHLQDFQFINGAICSSNADCQDSEECVEGQCQATCVPGSSSLSSCTPQAQGQAEIEEGEIKFTWSRSEGTVSLTGFEINCSEDEILKPRAREAGCNYGSAALGALVVEASQHVTLDTSLHASGFHYSSVLVKAGGLLDATGTQPLQIFATDSIIINGVVNISGGRGGNAGNDAPAAGGGAGGGALKLVAPMISIHGAVHADGGDGGDAGGPGQEWFANPSHGGNGGGGAGRAGGYDGGAGAAGSTAGAAGKGPGASGGGAYHSGVPPGPGGAGHASAGMNGFAAYSGMTQAGGLAYGDAQLSLGLMGGSGAGGGGNDPDNEEGSGGGGSGGTIYMIAHTIDIQGTVSAVGGLGGRDDYQYAGHGSRLCCNNGGSGSVGRIRLDAEVLSGSSSPAPGYSGAGCPQAQTTSTTTTTTTTTTETTTPVASTSSTTTSPPRSRHLVNSVCNSNGWPENRDWSSCELDSARYTSASTRLASTFQASMGDDAKDGREIAVVCCNMDGTEGSRNNCSRARTFEEAGAECAALGLRLCAQTELQTTCGSNECGFDWLYAWVSDSCTEESYYWVQYVEVPTERSPAGLRQVCAELGIGWSPISLQDAAHVVWLVTQASGQGGVSLGSQSGVPLAFAPSNAGEGAYFDLIDFNREVTPIFDSLRTSDGWPGNYQSEQTLACGSTGQLFAGFGWHSTPKPGIERFGSCDAFNKALCEYSFKATLSNCSASHEPCMDCLQSSDACLQAQPGWSRDHTCEGSVRWCEGPWASDMGKCCPGACIAASFFLEKGASCLQSAQHVSCPSGSSGENPFTGCECDAGYAGNITIAAVVPYFSGSCEAVPCPPFSSGGGLPQGCSCIAGRVGSITASKDFPDYHVGSCELLCPTDSSGDHVRAGCTCNAGYNGSIAHSDSEPYYTGACVAVDCPPNSGGANVPSGCSCNWGFDGTIEATQTPPYYSGFCATTTTTHTITETTHTSTTSTSTSSYSTTSSSTTHSSTTTTQTSTTSTSTSSYSTTSSSTTHSSTTTTSSSTTTHSNTSTTSSTSTTTSTSSTTYSLTSTSSTTYSSTSTTDTSTTTISNTTTTTSTTSTSSSTSSTTYTTHTSTSTSETYSTTSSSTSSTTTYTMSSTSTSSTTSSTTSTTSTYTTSTTSSTTGTTTTSTTSTTSSSTTYTTSSSSTSSSTRSSSTTSSSTTSSSSTSFSITSSSLSSNTTISFSSTLTSTTSVSSSTTLSSTATVTTHSITSTSISSTLSSTTRTTRTDMSFEESAAEAILAVNALAAAEEETVGKLMSLTAGLGPVDLTEPIQISESIETETGSIVATAVSPGAADENGFVAIATPKDSGVELAVPASVLMMAVSGDGSLPMLSVGSMNEDLAEKLKVAGQTASEDGDAGPIMASKPTSIQLYYSNGTEMKSVQLVEPMLMTIEVPNGTDPAKLKCAYWDEDLNAWSNKGVERVPDETGAVVCATHHLTIFATVEGEFKALVADAVQALVCSNAQGLMSEEGLQALWKSNDWWYRSPAIALWVFNFLCIGAMVITRGVDWWECRKVPWTERLQVYRTSIAQKKSLRRSRASVAPEPAERSISGRSLQGMRRLSRSATQQNLAASRGVLWAWQEVTGFNFDISSFLKDLSDAPNSVVTRCVRLVHSRKSGMDETSLKALITFEDDFQRASSIVPAPSPAQKLRRTASSLVESKDVRNSGKEAANTFLTTCWCNRLFALFLALHPVVALYSFSIQTSRSCRLALLVSKIVASGAAAAMFFEASGGALGDDADPACQPRKGWITEVVQAVVVGTACAFIGDIGMVILGILQRDRLWWGKCHNVRVAIFWVFFIAEYLACNLFMAIFLANVSLASSTEWLQSSAMSLLEEMVLMPLCMAFSLALLASLILCCRPSVAQKVRTVWESNDWAKEEDEDPAQELAMQLEEFSDQEEEKDEGAGSSNDNPEDALHVLRGLRHTRDLKDPQSPRHKHMSMCPESPMSPCSSQSSARRRRRLSQQWDGVEVEDVEPMSPASPTVKRPSKEPVQVSVALDIEDVEGVDSRADTKRPPAVARQKSWSALEARLDRLERASFNQASSSSALPDPSTPPRRVTELGPRTRDITLCETPVRRHTVQGAGVGSPEDSPDREPVHSAGSSGSVASLRQTLEGTRTNAFAGFGGARSRSNSGSAFGMTGVVPGATATSFFE